MKWEKLWARIERAETDARQRWQHDVANLLNVMELCCGDHARDEMSEDLRRLTENGWPDYLPHYYDDLWREVKRLANEARILP